MKSSYVACVLMAGVLGGLTSVGPAAYTTGAPACTSITAENTDDCVRMNQVQVIGTHNSYHLAPRQAVLDGLKGRGQGLEYTHRPLTEQLEALGIRQFELDIYADPEGGRYLDATANRLTGDRPDPALSRPGFKVFHVWDVDVRSTCATLVACLTEIKAWSEAHPRHLPVMVLLEAKDAGGRAAPAGRVAPHAIGVTELDALDREILSVFDAAHVITPDTVRGSHATLADAIREDGWPTLRQARGKVLFALDNTDAHRDDYLRGHPSLRGRVLFVTAPEGDAASAFLKLNEARGKAEAAIRARVGQGFLVRTRADEPTVEARNGDTTRRDSAFGSGAQYVSTDYPEPSPFGSGYIARLPGAPHIIARCNPVSAPAGCRDEWLEPRGTSR